MVLFCVSFKIGTLKYKSWMCHKDAHLAKLVLTAMDTCNFVVGEKEWFILLLKLIIGLNKERPEAGMSAWFPISNDVVRKYSNKGRDLNWPLRHVGYKIIKGASSWPICTWLAAHKPSTNTGNSIGQRRVDRRRRCSNQAKYSKESREDKTGKHLDTWWRSRYDR